MKKLILIVSIFFSVFSQSFAQNTLDSYSYVIVPEEYSFLAEKDQFQLNSMTKYLFIKNGFNAFYQFEISDVKICDGLVAEVIEKKGFTYTTLYVVLKDCKGNEVYKTEGGRSKFKEFRKAYHEALRNTFKSIEALNVSQGTVVVDIDKPTVIKNGLAQSSNTVLNKYSQYYYNNITHLLRKTSSGYFLYQDSEISENGLILLGKIKKEGNAYFLYISNNKHLVTFQNNRDMVIEKGEVKMNLKFQN